MIRELKNQDRFFRASCSDWEYMCLSKSHLDAAIFAIKEMFSLKGENLNLSFVLIVDEILDEKIKREVFYVPSVLADAGFSSLAKNFDSLYDFFLDNRAERH